MTSFELRGPIPPGSGPLARLAAPEFTGRVNDSLKHDFIQAVQRTVSNTEGIRTDLHALGWGINEITEAVVSLEHQLVPRFDAQIRYLSEQLTVLQSIDHSLKTPRRTQAAERISQAAHLLTTQQYDWALSYAREAIEHDATNPGGFMAAGWSLIGQHRIKDSIEYFASATKTAKDYTPYLESMRQLARCQLAIGDTGWARHNLGLAISYNSDSIRDQKLHITKLEKERGYLVPEATVILESREADQPALMYEAAIAAVNGRDDAAATAYIEAAVRLDVRYAKLAAGDPMLERRPAIVARAIHIATILEGIRQGFEDKKQKEIEEREAELPRLKQWHRDLESTFTQMRSPIYASDDIQEHEKNVRAHLDRFLTQLEDGCTKLEALTDTLEESARKMESLKQLWSALNPFMVGGNRKKIKILNQHLDMIIWLPVPDKSSG